MSPYTHNYYKDEDARLINAELASNKSDNSLEGKLQKNVSFNKFKPNDITIFIDKKDEVVPALHSNMTLDSEKPNGRARLLFIVTLLFILLLVCIVIISAVRQLTSDDHESFDHISDDIAIHFTSKNHTVFNSTSVTDVVPDSTVTVVPQNQTQL